ncbi:MAG: hypothetical protein ACOCWL_01345 [Thermoguttaceae bacterium]
MRYILSLGTVFALVWLPAVGCQQPSPQPPAHQFGGYHSSPSQPHQLQGGGVQQYPGAAEMPPAQDSGQQQFQPPAAHGSSTGEVEQGMPGSSPTQAQ